MKKITLLFILIPFLGLGQIQIGQDLNGIMSDSHFGNKVSLSSDGNVVAVSSQYTISGNGEGYTRIFRNVNSNWIQIGQDIKGEAFGDQFGRSLSVNSLGNIVAISAAFNDGISNNAGHVRVYENINNNWVQIGQDIEGDVNGIESAWSIEINASGDIIAIGSPFVNVNGGASGHVRVYEYINNNWTQIGQDINGATAGDWFGYSVCLSQNGNVVAMSSTDSDGNGPLLGYVKVFENINNTWIQVGNSIANTTNETAFGWDLEINNSGNILVVSELTNNINGTNTGNVRVFNLDNDSWSLLGNVYGENEPTEFGASIDLNSNGSILAVGASYSGIENDSGVARVFDISSLLSLEEQSISNFNLYPNPTKNQFTVQLNTTSILEKITIYNTLGQEVLKSEDRIVNTSKLASGSYIVEITTNKGKVSKKLIIE